MNGGYIMIDCKRLDLTLGDTPQTISGLYKEMQAAQKTGKPIYAYNMIWGEQGIVTPVQTFIVDFSADDLLIATASTLQIRVTSADSVTITNMAPAQA